MCLNRRTDGVDGLLPRALLVGAMRCADVCVEYFGGQEDELGPRASYDSSYICKMSLSQQPRRLKLTPRNPKQQTLNPEP